MKRWIKVKYGEFQVFFVWKYCYNIKNTFKVLFSLALVTILMPVFILAHIMARVFSFIEDNMGKLNPIKVTQNPEYDNTKNRMEKIEYWRNKLNIK